MGRHLARSYVLTHTASRVKLGTILGRAPRRWTDVGRRAIASRSMILALPSNEIENVRADLPDPFGPAITVSVAILPDRGCGFALNLKVRFARSTRRKRISNGVPFGNSSDTGRNRLQRRSDGPKPRHSAGRGDQRWPDSREPSVVQSQKYRPLPPSTSRSPCQKVHRPERGNRGQEPAYLMKGRHLFVSWFSEAQQATGNDHQHKKQSGCDYSS
jgi:hypothetical protein